MDYEKLRRDLVDYYGSAAFAGFPAAMLEAWNIKKLSNKQLLELARKNGFNLNKYKDK